MNQQPLITAAMELEAAKLNHDGQELSPAAQALYEQEGAERFKRHHPAWLFPSGQEGGAA